MRRMIAAAFVVAVIFSQPACAASINGLEWRQLIHTTGYSWDEVATVCNGVNNACSGSLTRSDNGQVRDFSGYTWASGSDVGTMFTSIDSNFSGPVGTPTLNTLNINYPWGETDLGQFSDTYLSSSGDIIELGLYGLTADSYSTASSGGNSLANVVGAYYSFSYTPLTGSILQAAALGDIFVVGTGAKSLDVGIWLYETPVAPVPLPAALPLLLSAVGFFGLLGWGRRKGVVA